MAKSIPATVNDQISAAKKEEISYRNLHKEIYVNDTVSNEVIKIPLNDVMADYKYFLDPYIAEVNVNDEELYHYMYNPKLLSYDLYGTTEYWHVLLLINNCVSKIDFNMRKIKVLDPQRIRGFVNEVLILEKIIK